MAATYDLHTHSTASDGTLTPAELVSCAAVLGVEFLALTDHDTTEGLTEAATAARNSGVTLVNGVEISVTWSAMTVHIVGLRFDPRNEALQQGLARLREFRAWRAEEIARRLEKKGITGGLDGALRHAHGRLISRTHFARFLVDKGYAANVREVFKKFLVKNRPGHVTGQWATLEEAVAWITNAGGQAVVAHPARYKLTRMKLLRLLGEFRECGGEGIEVVSGSHNKDECFRMARHAKEMKMLASAGSDYHGPENPYIDLGKLAPLPVGVRPIWEDWHLASDLAETA